MKILGVVAMILATANVVGGFVVTDRMLEMFKPKKQAPPDDGEGRRVSANVTNLLYLLTIVSFILALRFLSSPKTARRGNQIGALGMAIAIVVTLAQDQLVAAGYVRIAIGGAIGGAIGLVGARRVKMTAMPQMVALFNGVGGGAAAIVAFGEFHNARAARAGRSRRTSRSRSCSPR